MIHSNIDCLVIGAGPAGLEAAITAANYGARVLVADENAKPGGQLFKQIHKFFGSSEHMAGTRGYIIGQKLLREAEELGVRVMLDTLAWGIFEENVVALCKNSKSFCVQAKKIILATGATENTISFLGSTKPGVMTAGAAQTMANIQRVLPGKNILMVGTGNVGLIVSYQLMQAGARIVGIVEAMPKVGGYDVHANKLRKAGVPFYLSHTILEAVGEYEVERAVIAPVNERFCPDSSKAFTVKADTVCLAVGLSPRTDLAVLGGAKLHHSPFLGGYTPLHDRKLRVTEDLYIAGDVAGVEEASVALEEGKLAGLSVAESLGLLEGGEAEPEFALIWNRLNLLRSGAHGEKRKMAKEQIIHMGS